MVFGGVVLVSILLRRVFIRSELCLDDDSVLVSWGRRCGGGLDCLRVVTSSGGVSVSVGSILFM